MTYEHVFFSEWSREFHNYRVELVRKLLKKYKHQGTIVEIGCFSSFMAEVIEDDGSYTLDAFDIDPNAIKIVKKHYPNVNAFVADAEHPPKKKKYDVVFAGEIIEHLHNPEFAFGEWVELMNEDGVMILTTPNGIFCRGGVGNHIHTFDMKTLERMGQAHGLKILERIGIGVRTFTGSIDRVVPFDWLYKVTMPLTYSVPVLASNLVIVYGK